MLRTIFFIGLAAMLGMFAIGIAFKLFGFALGLLFVLGVLALKVAVIGLIGYVAIRILSPGTAKRLRERWDETKVRQY
ncbi:MAG: hypothetical protein H0W69_10585 [Gemmatimonadaceae bacterium]|nr:hypothetical protein [Gemmatimonadaceae bacterium]